MVCTNQIQTNLRPSATTKSENEEGEKNSGTGGFVLPTARTGDEHTNEVDGNSGEENDLPDPVVLAPEGAFVSESVGKSEEEGY